MAGLNRAAFGRLSVGYASAPTTNMFFVRSDSDNDAAISNTVQIQRYARANEYPAGNVCAALRTYCYVGASVTDQYEWCINTNMDVYADSGEHVGISSVVLKYGLAPCWAYHMQITDSNNYASATDVTAILGFEANARVIGLDDPTLNNGVGLRFVGDIIARAYSGVGVTAEVGCGLRIRCDNSVTSNGYFRYGLVLDEGSGNPNPMGTGIFVNTSGAYGIRFNKANTTAQIYMSGDAAYGILMLGTYTTGAIRLPAGQHIAMESTNVVKFYYNSGTSAIVFNNASTTIVSIGATVGGTFGIEIVGTQTQNLRLAGDAAYGITANGTYSSGTAFRMNTGMHIALEASNVIRFAYNTSNSSIEWKSSTNVRMALSMGASPVLTVGGSTVVTAANLGTIVNGLAEETTPDASADFLLLYDTSGSVSKKVKPANLPAATVNLPWFFPEDYGAAGDGTTDDRADINSAINAAYAAGGGVVMFDAKTYGVKGTGDKSDGAIQVKSDVHLVGCGYGATIIKVLDSQASVTPDAAITGVIRTPSGEAHSNITISHLSIDGNGANVAYDVDGFYTGVAPSHLGKIVVSGTTATLTSYNDAGSATRNHGLSSSTIYIKHDTLQWLTGDFAVTVTGATTLTFTVESGHDGYTDNYYTWYYDKSYALSMCTNIKLFYVEIYGCYRYGFDPHEGTDGLELHSCIAHGNGVGGAADGFTLDCIFNFQMVNCIAYSNGRNGFNIVTGGRDGEVVNCISRDNTQYGFAVQRGSNSSPRCRNIKFKGGSSYKNGKVGVRLHMTLNSMVEGMNIYENGEEGVKIEGCDATIVANNNIQNNSQTTTNTDDNLLLTEYAFAADSVTYPTQYTKVSNNIFNDVLTKKSRYSFRENEDSSDYNEFLFNTIVNPGSTGGAYVRQIANKRTKMLDVGNVSTLGLGLAMRSMCYL